MTVSNFRTASRMTSLLTEWMAVLLIGLLYFSLITPPLTIASTITDHLDLTPLQRTLLDPAIRQSGLEHERLAGVLLPVKIGLDTYGRIPTWNSYIATGEPTINNAFSYLFNPFHSLPILLFGGVQGSKLATFIAILIAGYSIWAFARVLGLGAVARVTTAALYMMSGGIMGKFYTGHFQLALSLGWPPFVFAALWWTLHSRTRLAPVSFGIAFALLFFAGNIYYVLHTLLCCAFIIAFHLLERISATKKSDNESDGEQKTNRNNFLVGTRYIVSHFLPLSSAKPPFGTKWRGGWGVRIIPDRLRRVALAGAFAFGLAALQFFPVWQTRDYVDHPGVLFNTDGSIQGSYDMGQTIANLTYPWPDWRTFETLSIAPLVAVDYAYIGAAPFLLILLALLFYAVYVARHSSFYPAFSPQHVALFFLLALIMMIWGAGQTTILQWLYTTIPLLAEFRFLGRALAIAALWWIVLAGIAIDILWKAAYEFFAASPLFAAYNRLRLLRAFSIAVFFWGYWLIYSLANASTRQIMALYNFRLLNSLDEHRFTTFPQAVNALWSLILIAVVVDTVLLVIERLIRPRFAVSRGVGWPVYGTRLVQAIVMTIAVAAILDIMTVNSRLFDFQPVTPGFTTLYPDIHQWDTNPFPSVSEPFGPLAFDAYENGIRSFSLTEGWRLWSPLGVIPGLNTLPDMPRWIIVSNAYSGTAQDYAQKFADYYNYTRKKCYPIHSTSSPADPCLMDFQHIAAVLYEKPDVLPYAFIVSGERLFNDPASLNATNVLPVQEISHQLDTITVQATPPPRS